MIAPDDQNIRDDLGQDTSSGNGQQMALPLGARVLRQRGVI
jgi:hypothetical protein